LDYPLPASPILGEVKTRRCEKRKKLFCLSNFFLFWLPTWVVKTVYIVETPSRPPPKMGEEKGMEKD
jgi:hypothetical protein